MDLLNIISCSIENGLTALANTNITTGNDTLQHRGLFTQYINGEDLEMNALDGSDRSDPAGILRATTNDDEDRHRSLSTSIRFTTVIRKIANFRMPFFGRSRFLREMGEITQMSIILAFVAAVALIWPLYGYPLRWAMEPLGASFRDISSHNWDQIRKNTIHWLTSDTKHTTTSHIDPVYVPGFYLVPVAERMPDVLHNTAERTDTTTSANTLLDAGIDSPENFWLVTTTSQKPYSEGQTGPLHHAYPIHAGRINKSSQALRIKSQLERCAENMLTKLRGQVLEITPGFEFALHDCKSAVDFALETLYPPHKIAATKINLSSKRSVPGYGLVPGQASPLTASTTQAFNSFPQNNNKEFRLRSLLSKRSNCSENFCEWATSKNLDRCYRRDEAEFARSGKVSYTNDSVDDFKDNAPLECNLCLPETDHEEIDIHCREVKVSEKDVVKHLLIVFGVLGIVAIVGILAKNGWKRYRGHANDRATNSLPLRRERVPVMPKARSSAVSVRGGRLDKRAISSPVLIRHPAEEMEGSFKNPRPAPLPPLV